MFDLSFYSLLVAVKSFEPIDKADLSDYYAKDSRLDIDSLFLMFTSGMNNYKEKTLDEVIQYCSSIANDICKLLCEWKPMQIFFARLLSIR